MKVLGGRWIANRAAWVLVLGTALLAIALLPTVHDWLLTAFEDARRLIEEHPVSGAVGFVVLAAVSAMLAFFSSSLLVAPAVFAWGPLATASLLWLGWALGGVASYGLARWVGRPALRLFLRDGALAVLEDRLSPSTPFGIVLLVQLSLPSEIPGALLGLVRYPMRKFLAALALAELPWAAGTVLLGESFVQRRVGALLALGAGAAAAALVIRQVLRTRLPASGTRR